MQVFDEATQTWKSQLACRKVILEISNGFIIFGYSSNRVVNVFIKLENTESRLYIDLNLYKGPLLFSKFRGTYFIPIGYSDTEIYKELNIKGYGDFPYTFSRKYEAVNNFDLFNGKQELLNTKNKSKYTKYLKYTFGLEFETSQGYIPEDVCFRDGLIPLRDGSITGLEYSTVVLSGNYGMNLLNQQLNTLSEYTNFNKECSLHIHCGGFPLDSNKIFRVYKLCYLLEQEISSIIPRWTFHSKLYKVNEKDYCKPLREYHNFAQLYYGLVGRKYNGSLEQPHPNDIERSRKWNVLTRYYWCNFINILCYKVNKTIEFRFLRPTYNYKKILLWIYIFNAILLYAEAGKPLYEDIKLADMLKSVYPKELFEVINLGVQRLDMLTYNQNLNSDLYGGDISMEGGLFNDLKLLYTIKLIYSIH